MCDSILSNGIINPSGSNVTKTDIRTRMGCNAPGVAPSVAMKQGEGPQIDGSNGDLPDEEIAQSCNISSSMGEKNALRARCCT